MNLITIKLEELIKEDCMELDFPELFKVVTTSIPENERHMMKDTIISGTDRAVALYQYIDNTPTEGSKTLLLMNMSIVDNEESVAKKDIEELVFNLPLEGSNNIITAVTHITEVDCYVRLASLDLYPAVKDGVIVDDRALQREQIRWHIDLMKERLAEEYKRYMEDVEAYLMIGEIDESKIRPGLTEEDKDRVVAQMEENALNLRIQRYESTVMSSGNVAGTMTILNELLKRV